ncbi:hypothetical protein F5884DRAFT_299337 [Xylogone sp. PMI_703]|nr:hypothetical protein F5884DRAFT_299337 [Xylogone sp. PMI_703]
MQMSPATIILTGAPLSDALNWNSEQLLDSFSKPISRFARLEGPASTQDAEQNNTQDVITVTPGPTASTSLLIHPSWRSVPLTRQYLHTGVSQDHHAWGDELHGASFFTVSDTNSFTSYGSSSPEKSYKTGAVTDEMRSEFYEHSFHVREAIPSSAIPDPNAEESFDTSVSTSISNTDSSFSITGVSFTSGPSSSVTTKVIPVSGPLADLRAIPTAKHLISIQPQTVTVNLIVGLISISEPRPVRTKRGETIELVELCVGDETKAGFEITFWLSDKPTRRLQPAKNYDSRSTLSSLRIQDIVLIRNVALGSFRGRVYGQSLRKDATKVHLLYRHRLDRTDIGGCYSSSDLDLERIKDLSPQALKTARVKDWVSKFVGVRKRAADQNVEELPPDTQ